MGDDVLSCKAQSQKREKKLRKPCFFSLFVSASLLLSLSQTAKKFLKKLKFTQLFFWLLFSSI
ncbi:MAG: hypothetical protein EAZ06_10585 [Cytophagales bacterium]|nr:MAG: hypothetical protein EAZ06_10585 [Cytophagales bacterium]